MSAWCLIVFSSLLSDAHGVGLTSAVSIGTRLLPALGITAAGVSRLRSRRTLLRSDDEPQAEEQGPPRQRIPDREIRRRLTGGDEVEGIELRGADLSRLSLSGCTALRGRDLTGARLRKADLAGADLSGSRLDHADASGASFKGAVLRDCSVTDASFVGADVTDADLRGMRNASTATWTRIQHSSTTRWPATYDPRTAGTVMERLGGDSLALHRLPGSRSGRTWT